MTQTETRRKLVLALEAAQWAERGATDDAGRTLARGERARLFQAITELDAQTR